jgi:hypothetical protein
LYQPYSKALGYSQDAPQSQGQAVAIVLAVHMLQLMVLVVLRPLSNQQHNNILAIASMSAEMLPVIACAAAPSSFTNGGDTFSIEVQWLLLAFAVLQILVRAAELVYGLAVELVPQLAP